jgi:hypothetical protein
MNRKKEVALHEAGHAVVARMLGKSYGCQLHGEGDATGGMAGPGDLSTPAKAESYSPDRCTAAYSGDTLPDLMTDATITAAGSCAVATALCELNVFITTADRRLMAAACREAFPESDFYTEEAFCRLAACRARSLLNQDFRRVERVADALHERGRLSADDVAQLMK